MMQKDNQYIAYNGTAFDSEETCIEYEQLHIIADYADGIKFFDENHKRCYDVIQVIEEALLCRIINADRAKEMIAVIDSWHNDYIRSFFPTCSTYENDDVLFYHYVNECWISRRWYTRFYNLLNSAFSLGE